MKMRVGVIGWLLAGAAFGFAGGAGDLQDYAPSPAAVRLLAEYERLQEEGFMSAAGSAEPARVVAYTREWLERSEEVRADAPAYHYLRARIEYDAYNQMQGSEAAARRGYLDRASQEIRTFVQQQVAFADGHALHGAILGQKIAANPASALLYADTAKRANRTALKLDPNNQMAHLNLGFTFVFTPEAFGGDRKLAVKHFRRAFAGGALVMRAVAGVWLSVTYDQLGESARAVEAIEAVLELAPGFPLAEATARALADGADPQVYLQRLQTGAE